jgi:hypothetical protein
VVLAWLQTSKFISLGHGLHIPLTMLIFSEIHSMRSRCMNPEITSIFILLCPRFKNLRSTLTVESQKIKK